MNEPLQIEASHQVHKGAADSAEADHGDLAAHNRFGTTLKVDLVINSVGTLAHCGPIEIHVACAVHEESGSELGGSARWGGGSIRDRQPLKKRPREARLHSPAAVCNHAELRREAG